MHLPISTSAARPLAGLAVVLAVAVALQAAQSGGTLTATVADAAGHPMPGATISVAAPDHRQAVHEVTDRVGRYAFNSLPAGSYTIVVSMDGFATFAREGIDVRPGAAVALNVTLAPRGRAVEPMATVGPPALPAPAVPVRIETPFGAIDLAIDTVHAPITAGNFLKYVDGGFYRDGRFYRTTRPDTYHPVLPDRPPMRIIQGGRARNVRPGIPPIPLERTSVTGLRHTVGVISMARNGPDTATSEFFILLDDQPSLDFGGKRFDDAQGAAAFGRVTAGLDVVRTINQQPVSDRQATPDNPLTHTQNLTPPVPITAVCRFPATTLATDGQTLTGTAQTGPGCS